MDPKDSTVGTSRNREERAGSKDLRGGERVAKKVENLEASKGEGTERAQKEVRRTS